MGLKHPGEYIQSFIANTYQYYYMEFRNKRGLYLKPEIMDFYIRKRPWVQKSEAIQKLIRKLQVHVPENLKSVREKGVLAMDISASFSCCQLVYKSRCNNMDDAYWILCTLDKEEIHIYT